MTPQDAKTIKGLTYLEALDEAKAGKAIRCGLNGEGWLAHWAHGALWWVNPATGTELSFSVTPEQQARTDWIAQ